MADCLSMQWGSCRQASKTVEAPATPKNHREAMSLDSAGWGAAELKEILNHENNESYRVGDASELPRGRRLVNFTWAYKVKRSGQLKARLCVQGCTQVPGVDYNQTFCAAMRQSSLRVLSSAAARLNLAMNRWDFVSAYLQGSLLDDEVVYCRTPPGVTPTLGKDGREQIYVVLKPIYGMSQAGRRWQRTLFPYLLKDHKAWKFEQSFGDPCVFYCRREVSTPSGTRSELLIVGCYVDDLFVLSSHRDEYSLYSLFTSDLESDWDVEDEGCHK